MTHSKTTVAISKDSRKMLGKIKLVLEDKSGSFVDLGETIEFLLKFYQERS